MLKFNRNKLVTIARESADTLKVHGALDDDIYGLEIDLEVNLPKMEILSIEGRWNRFTTPECPRSEKVLQEAVGISIKDEDFKDKVQKIISRKACRHFANIFLECCHSVKEAVIIVSFQDSSYGDSNLEFDKFLGGSPEESREKRPYEEKVPRKQKKEKAKIEDSHVFEKIEGGMVIDLHTHTSPASPCSSAPVDELIEEAKRIGLDGICLTDHNFEWDDSKMEELRRKHDFLILKGNEIITDQGDILVFGLDEDIKGVTKLEDLRAKVDDAGGVMIAAHPFRGFLVVGAGQLGLTPEKAMGRKLFKMVDAVEVLNGKVTEKENNLALQVGEGLGLSLVGGSDAHEVSEVGTYATRFQVVIRNEEDLVRALKQGHCSPETYRKNQTEKK
ncbi:CehA/McbA family metallohydrolase [Thermodesulfobacteriota bacterium]